MPTATADRTKAQEYVFVLWGDRFEEKAVATFITEFRDLGLAAKVVGLAGQRATGKHGLVLAADLTLGEALELANQAICLVAPCSPALMKHIDNDPRVLSLFRHAHTNQARFVVRELDTLEKSSLKKLAIPSEAVILYAERADVTALARELASLLLKRNSKRQAFDPSAPQVAPSPPVGLSESGM